MATIGTMAVNIVATTDKFLSGINSASTSLGRFVKRISSVQNAVGGLVTTGLGMLANAAVEAGGRVFELTKKLGISAEGITALHFAADQLESSAGAVDNALAKMVVTLGKAVTGSREARNAFTSIGLNWQKLSKLPVQDQFLAVVNALNKIPNAAKRAAAGQAIFGKGSRELSALIAAGTSEIIKQGQRASDLGAIMSTEVAQSLDDAGDSVAALKAQWAALRNEIVAMFSGETATGLLTFATKTIQVAKTIGYAFRGMYLEVLTETSRFVSLMAKMFNVLLPKALEIDTQFVDQLSDSFTIARDQQFKNMQDVWKPADNPLKPPTADAEIAKNTSDIKDSMDRLNVTMSELVAQQRAAREREGMQTPPTSDPALTIAGVR